MRNIQAVGNKLISLHTKHPTLYNIKYLVKSPFISEWCDTFFSNYQKMAISTTFNTPFLCYLLPPNAKILRPIIYVRVKKTDIDNRNNL